MSNYFVIYKDRVRKNIDQMAKKAEINRILFRPHFKTHQNLKVANMFREIGITTISVSSVKMAKFFAEDGWKDIFIAFPLDINEIKEIDELAGKINLTLLINDKAHLDAMENLNNQVDFMIEIDAGYHRSGINFVSWRVVMELINYSVGIPQAQFIGLSAHFGNSYIARNPQQIMGIGLKSINRLSELAMKLEKHMQEYIYISIGDTPTASILNQFPRVDELRPGNFVFYDLMQIQIGSCELNQVAALMRCAVVSKNNDQKQLIIHGGSNQFSKEYIDFPKMRTYGHLVDTSSNDWQLMTSHLSELSQEHGIVDCTPDEFDKYQIGDYVHIIPVHSCLTANLMKENTLFE